MIDLLHYVLESFWRWMGFVIILQIVLFYGVNGIVELVKELRKN